jgi:hypothetical protein
VDAIPDDPAPDAVGLVTCAGPVIGVDAPTPGAFASPQPLALLVLHPPSETSPSTPEADGTVTRLLSSVNVELTCDPDLAVLATLCAA